MKSIELNAIIREKVGKKASKQFRKKELIPCEIYGQGNNMHIAIEEKYLNKIVFTPYTYYAIINIDNKKINAIVKEVQFNPVTDRISHIDFYEVVEDKPIVAQLPVKVVGLAKGVKDGGKLLQEMRYVKVKGLLKNMIEIIEINVDSLGLGKSIHTGDLDIPNLKVVDSPEKIIVTVKVTRGAVTSSEGENTETKK